MSAFLQEIKQGDHQFAVGNEDVKGTLAFWPRTGHGADTLEAQAEGSSGGRRPVVVVANTALVIGYKGSESRASQPMVTEPED